MKRPTALELSGHMQQLRLSTKVADLYALNKIFDEVNAQAKEINAYRAELEFISKVDMVTNAHDAEHTQASVRDWATRALEIGSDTHG